MSYVESQSPLSDDSKKRIEDARNGCKSTLGELLDDARRYLYPLARSAIDSDIQGKLSASDLVQETMVDAHRSFRDFHGDNTRQLIAWLRRILINNLLNHYRHLRSTQKRDVSREFGDLNIDNLTCVDEETPSGVAMRHEETAVLEEELARLPQPCRELIELRHRDQMSFVDMAEALGKTPDAVRMAWYRAFDRLSKALEQCLG